MTLQELAPFRWSNNTRQRRNPSKPPSTSNEKPDQVSLAGLYMELSFPLRKGRDHILLPAEMVIFAITMVPVPTWC
jgi:hypothetical protein